MRSKAQLNPDPRLRLKTAHAVTDPIQISADIFRHGPAAVKFLSATVGKLTNVELKSRYLKKQGIIVEVSPPISITHLIVPGEEVSLRIRLPYQDEFIVVSGLITKVVGYAVDPMGLPLSLIGVKFQNLDTEVMQKLEAHDITVESIQGQPRAARIPVKFPLDLGGIDFMNQLFARDLSMSGMFVAGLTKFNIGKTLRFIFRLPFQKREVSVTGKIIWLGEKAVRDTGVKTPGFGIQFVEIPPISHASLATYYARNTMLS